MKALFFFPLFSTLVLCFPSTVTLEKRRQLFTTLNTSKELKNTGDQPATFTPRLALLKAAAPVRTFNKPPFPQDDNNEDEFPQDDHARSNKVDHVRVLEKDEEDEEGEEEDDSSESWFPSDDEE